MIAETLAGISLLKASVDFIKSNIDTAKDIGEIAGAVDGLFRGHDEVQAERSKKSGVTIGDQFGIKSVAQEMKNMINMRFGPNTWQTIVDERAKRIQEHKEEMARIKREKLREQAEFVEQMKMMAIILMAMILGCGAFIYVMYTSV